MGYLSQSDADTLTEARRILHALNRVAFFDRNDDQAMQRGMFAEACDSAEHAIFSAMNVAQAYLDDEIAKSSIADYSAERQARPPLMHDETRGAKS